MTSAFVRLVLAACGIEQREGMVRRALLLLTATTAALFLASRVAMAAALVGTGGPDAISGTVEDDSITGLGGDDLLAGDPSLFGPGGDDALSGGPGDDLMDTFNDPAFPHVISCGPGDDRAYADGTDLVAGDCERVILGPHPDPWDENPFQPAPLGR